jgi:hypothetical protein
MGHHRILPFVLAQDDQVGIASAITDAIGNITIRLEPPRINWSPSYLFLKGLLCGARV